MDNQNWNDAKLAIFVFLGIIFLITVVRFMGPVFLFYMIAIMIFFIKRWPDFFIEKFRYYYSEESDRAKAFQQIAHDHDWTYIPSENTTPYIWANDDIHLFKHGEGRNMKNILVRKVGDRHVTTFDYSYRYGEEERDTRKWFIVAVESLHFSFPKFQISTTYRGPEALWVQGLLKAFFNKPVNDFVQIDDAAFSERYQIVLEERSERVLHHCNDDVVAWLKQQSDDVEVAVHPQVVFVAFAEFGGAAASLALAERAQELVALMRPPQLSAGDDERPFTMPEPEPISITEEELGNMAKR